MMIPPVPTLAQVATALGLLRQPQLEKLSELSGVPVGTLWNIRSGKSANPGIVTVAAFQPYVQSLVDVSLAAPPDARAPRGTSLRARQGVTRRKKRHPPEPALGDVVTPRGDEVPRGGPVDLPGSAAP
jgi:transcriptional regulator with XRE-family HTH domain